MCYINQLFTYLLTYLLTKGAPSWLSESLACSHASQVDVQMNSAMCLVSGTLRSTPLPWLPVLSNIEPPALRKKAEADRLVEKIFKHVSWPIQPDIRNPPQCTVCGANAKVAYSIIGHTRVV